MKPKKCLQNIHFRFFINLVFFGFAEAAAANLNEVWLESSQAITKVTKVLLCDARGWRLLAGGHSFGLLLLGVLLLGNCFAVRIGGFWRFKVCRCFFFSFADYDKRFFSHPNQKRFQVCLFLSSVFFRGCCQTSSGSLRISFQNLFPPFLPKIPATSILLRGFFAHVSYSQVYRGWFSCWTPICGLPLEPGSPFDSLRPSL